jgi:large subunit ribosomal protein L3
MGANTDPARVFKGKKMPGHLGAANVTVQNLSVVQVDGERNILVIRGAVPGPKGGVVEIKNSVKSK